MITMKTLFVLTLLVTATTWAFLPHPMTSRRLTSCRLDASIPEAMERLTSEYKELQQKLWTDIRARKRVEVMKDAVGMLERAVDLNALERYEQEQKIMAAQHAQMEAADKAQYAQQIKKDAHREASWADKEVNMVESIEDSYEDLERLRDLSVSHAAHDLENDAKELEFDATFEGFAAKINKMRATDLLCMLNEKEKALKKSLKKARALENKEAMNEWAKKEIPKHENIIKVLKRHKLIDHDPTKGNVAF